MSGPRNKFYLKGLAIICAMAVAPGETILLRAQSQQPSQAPENQQGQVMGAEQLDSLVSPIALYPDPLLAQILAASTYPMEIVTADRWVQQNRNLAGKDLAEAAGKQDWDPSIQALVVFPTVLQMMDQNVEWTTALGNEFLAQPPAVMAAVQRMRFKAQEAGKLQSTSQQQVQTTAVDGQPTILIQPADPQVIYVPSYDPAAVYGEAPGYYPYPAIAYPSAGAVFAAGAISFAAGVAVGSIFNGCCGGGWGWGWGCHWGPRASLYVNNNFFVHNSNTFVNRGNWGNAYRGNGQAGWNHNPRYRGAVPYANRAVADRYNGGRPAGARPPGQAGNIGNIKPGGGQGNASRLPENIGNAKPATVQGGANRLPGNVGGANRSAAGVSNRPSGGAMGETKPPAVGSANRAGAGSQWGSWSGSKPPSSSNRGGAFGGGNAGAASRSSNRGFGSMGGSGGVRRGGGGRRR